MNSPLPPRPSLRALLVDDERLARKHLRQLLASHPGVVVVGEADSVEEAARMAARERPDILFLDIQMPPSCGFDLLPLLDPAPHIVFVTAHDAFAVRAFEENALDYLLKPVHPDRLAKTLRRFSKKGASLSGPTPTPGLGCAKLELSDPVTLRDKRSLRIVSARAIAAVRAEGAYSRVILSGQAPMLVFGPIREWEARLPSPPFARLERSLIVNLGLIRKAEASGRDNTGLELEGVAGPLRLGRIGSWRLRRLLKKQPGVTPQ